MFNKTLMELALWSLSESIESCLCVCACMWVSIWFSDCHFVNSSTHAKHPNHPAPPLSPPPLPTTHPVTLTLYAWVRALKFKYNLWAALHIKTLMFELSGNKMSRLPDWLRCERADRSIERLSLCMCVYTYVFAVHLKLTKEEHDLKIIKTV